MSTQIETMAKAITVNRTKLLHCLDRAKQVAPARCCKIILSGVRLEATGGMLTACATDLDISALVQVPTDGELLPCVVPCQELIRRLKASKSETCTLRLSDDADRLIVNGGRVEHALQTLDVAEFPVVPSAAQGDSIEVNAAEFCRALSIAGVGVAREPSRYAINGVLLESDNGGTRLAATDGRRLVVIELADAGQLDGQFILPQRLCRLIEKFTSKGTDYLVFSALREHTEKGDPLPARLYAAGPDWLISTYETEGCFPQYRDYVPRSGSRFAVDGSAFLETLNEVSLATSIDSHAVCVDLSAGTLGLSAHAPGVGDAEATLPASFIGGGDNEIHTAFNPAYLIDALKTLGSSEVVIQVEQNGLGSDRSVFSKPALLYRRHDPSVRWLLMPISRNLEPTRANLGSNYREPQENTQS